MIYIYTYTYHGIDIYIYRYTYMDETYVEVDLVVVIAQQHGMVHDTLTSSIKLIHRSCVTCRYR